MDVSFYGREPDTMPGLVDMHVHTWDEEELVLFIANGVTTIRNMFGAPLHLAWRRRINAGELFGPTLYTTGPVIDGKPPYWPGSAVVETPQPSNTRGRRTQTGQV